MNNVSQIFQDFIGLNVLIIGDVMIDNYLTGKVNRVSPEAPVPVLDWQREENRLGGAANVALNIKALGATPYLCSVIGNDEEGNIFLDLLSNQKISKIGLIQSASRKTTIKTRVIAQGQHLLRIDKEQKNDLEQLETNQLLVALKDIIQSTKIDAILFQDYNKGVLTKDIIHKTILEAQKWKIPTVVDPKFKNFWSYQNVSLFKPNLKEIRDALKEDVNPNDASLRKAVLQIHEKLNCEKSIITLSDKGLYVFDGNDGLIIPTQPRNIADVCGAGDTVISICALGTALSLNLKTIGHLANLGGGQVCEKIGVVHVEKEILEKEFASLMTNQNEIL